MPPPRELLEQMAEARRREHVLAERDRRRDLLRTALACLAWCALGLFLLGWSFHTTDAALGRVAFLSGLLVGNGGIVHALAAAYRRGERRGDWQ